MPLDMKCLAASRTSLETVAMLTEFWASGGTGYTIWQGERPLAVVLLGPAINVLNHMRLSDDLIDAWGEILQLMYHDYASSHATMIFTSKCWSQIACSPESDGIRKAWVDDRIEEAMEKEVLLFPLLTCGSSTNRRSNGDHWTLLKYTVKANEWRFFNPMKPRAGIKDPHFQQALLVVKYIEDKMKEVHAKRQQKTVPGIIRRARHPKEPIEAHCPQQEPGSLDCGVVICWLIEMALLRIYKKIDHFTAEFAADYRKKMVQWVLDMLD